MRYVFFPFAVALLWAGRGLPARADETPALNPEQVRRLETLGKLWGTVRYFHPQLAYREIDWDAALVKAAPRVAKAKTTQEYLDAVRGMLAALADPATAVVRQPPRTVKAGAGKPFTWGGDGILAVHLTDPEIDLSLYTRRAELAALAKEIRKARAVIFDLRDGA